MVYDFAARDRLLRYVTGFLHYMTDVLRHMIDYYGI
jgi:hypothetical protein